MYIANVYTYIHAKLDLAQAMRLRKKITMMINMNEIFKIVMERFCCLRITLSVCFMIRLTVFMGMHAMASI